jgi:hypothetical protein
MQVPSHHEDLRSPNVTITLDNFTQNVKSSFVTEAHTLEAVTTYLTNNVSIKVTAPRQVMFLYFLK